jgi:hypothetical protein
MKRFLLSWLGLPDRLGDLEDDGDGGGGLAALDAVEGLGADAGEAGEVALGEARGTGG